jgi:Dyp-type peroxidase family
MPINLNAPLAWEKANPDTDEIAMLNDLQGNILKGHGRPHTQNLFVSFKNSDEGKKFLKNLAKSIKSAYQQLRDAREYRQTHKDTGIFISVFLSAAGYKALGITEAKIPDNSAFRSGLKQRKDILSDPEIEEWDPAFQEEEDKIHAMILIGGMNETQVRQERNKIQKEKPTSVKIIGTEYGLAMRNKNGDGIEHFGYVDGRSQPLLLQEDIDCEKNKDGIDIWDPTFPLKQVLVPCPGGASSTTSFGSYFVFRKLEQNVKGFKKREEEIAKDLGLTGDDEELVGAMIVGRFEDGTPVVLQGKDGLVKPVRNNFDFKDDPDGNKCPFHAHIRKTNPRGESVQPGVTLEEERSRIMARRGITYGTRNAELNDEGNIIELKDKPVGGVGLLFMAYQNSLENQFEFTQASWANNPNFVKPNTGIDPVIGEKSEAATPQQQPTDWGSNTKKPIDFHGFVTMKGGEYFFAPCISFFKNL